MTDKNYIREIAREYFERLVLPSEPLRPLWNCENVIFRKQPKWNYMDFCMIGAVLRAAGEMPELADYAVRFTNAYVQPDGTIPTLHFEDYNLDNIRGGCVLLELHRLTGEERYRLAADRLYGEQLSRQPRLSCGCFWHKAIYPNQVWLDGTFMAPPFMAAYGKTSGNRAIVDDALDQLRTVRRLMADPVSGLYHHGYDETRTMCWADPESGLSPEIWLRSNGWLCAALAEVYELTGDAEIGGMLSDLVGALSRCMTADNMLLQLPMRPELPGNYPETSGTLLFAYGALKGARLGAVSSELRDAGERALMAVADKYIVHRDGMPVLKNICLMGGLGGENNRDGSAGYYLSEPIVENDAKGIAPFLMAAAEFLR